MGGWWWWMKERVFQRINVAWCEICFQYLSLFFPGTNPMKSTCTCEVAAGASTYVENVAFAVKNRACWRSTFERTPTSVRTFASTATLPSKPKVGGENEKKDCFCSLFSVITSVCLTGSRRASIFRLLSGNLTKHMKSKAHGKKCQAMGVSESSLDDPESEEAGTLEWAGQTFHISAPPRALWRILVHIWMNCLLRLGAAPRWQLMQHCVLFYSPWPCIRNVKKS